MTNGQKLIIDFPNMRYTIFENRVITTIGVAASFDLEWWNDEYKDPRKGEWLRMSNLLEEQDDRYKCSRCGNVIHYKDKMDLYTFNSFCGRCGSDNGRKIEVNL